MNSFLLVTSVQAGAVMADSKHVDPYRGWHDGSAGQPDLCSCHCGVYIRCDGTAVIPRRIYSWIWGRHAEVELHRLSPLVYDYLPCVVWRVDPVNVGLHERQWADLCPVLFVDLRHRQPGCKFKSIMASIY